MSNASLICGSLNGISCVYHWSYTSGPAVRRTTSSTKSVPAQPVASPDSTPAHHGMAPSSTICCDRSIMSSQVSGISYPASSNMAGEYQTKDLTFAPSGAA